MTDIMETPEHGVSWQIASEANYAEQLTRSNMARYYQSRGWRWDSARYHATWNETENVEVWHKGERVGIIRIALISKEAFETNDEQRCLFVHDLQLDPSQQGLGIGRVCIEWVKHRAAQQGIKQVRLRVFSENRAQALYRRMGFRVASEQDGLVEMALNLA
ncbi:GNAT family N-acetyltransferase [Vibrio fluvialis]|nr:GNAT family N-acetyltransferase [Vibrio fluvialis]